MQGFAYTAPDSVAAVLAVLTEHKARGARAQLLAGGTDLIVQMRTVDRSPRTIVDVKKVAETNRLEVTTERIYIGAAVPGAVLTANEALVACMPGLVESVDLIGSTQIQGRASLGGNLCNASPAGDTLPALIANAGRCVIAGPGGERRVPVEAFVTGVQENALAADEFLLGVEFDPPAARTADAYLRFIPRTEMDIAVAGAGVSITMDGPTCTAARVGIGAVAPTPLLVGAAADALIGTDLTASALAQAAQAASDAARPISDKRGTVEYRRRVVGVLVKRAVQRAMARIGG